ncbi:MAG: motility associated factor glycosyltransferase family protein [Chlamydiae bacterium]|nr:motility associated factor glycosyltransferase family protein [Chlamydiota bacterium]
MSKVFEENYSILSSRFAISSFFAQSLKSTFKKKKWQEPKDWQESLKLHEVEILYVYGLSLSFDRVKKWLHEKKERRVIFFEDNPNKLNLFLHQEKAKEILEDPQVYVYYLISEELFLQDIALNFFSDKVLVATSKKETQKFLNLKSHILKRSTFAHYYCFDRINASKLFINFLKNVKKLPTSFYLNKLKDQFKNIPAIICGAGPSLDLSIKLLSKLKSQALIIAGGSAIAALTKQGISPHFGVVIDPNEEEYLRMKKNMDPSIPMLYSTRVHPDVFKTFKGSFGYFKAEIGGKSETWLDKALNLQEELLDKELLDRSLSVTSTCIAIAAYLGCSHIILNGVDLAFSNQKLYADGVIDPKDNKLNLANLISIQDKNKKPSFTSITWMMEGDNISQWAQKSKHKLIDATPFGYELKGVKKMSLEDFFKKSLPNKLDLNNHLQSSIQKASFDNLPSVDLLIEKLKGSFLRSQELILQIIEENSSCGEDSAKTIVLKLELEEEEAYQYFLYDYLYIADNKIQREKLPTTKWHLLKKSLDEFLASF